MQIKGGMQIVRERTPYINSQMSDRGLSRTERNVLHALDKNVCIV